MSPRLLVALGWQWLHHSSAPRLSRTQWRHRVLLTVVAMGGLGAAAALWVASRDLGALPARVVLPAVFGSIVSLVSLGVAFMETRIRRGTLPRTLVVLPLSSRHAALLARVHVLVLAIALCLVAGPPTIALLVRYHVAPLTAAVLTAAALTGGVVTGSAISAGATAGATALGRPRLFGVAVALLWLGWFAASGLHATRAPYPGESVIGVLLVWPATLDLAQDASATAVVGGALVVTLGAAASLLLWTLPPAAAEPATSWVSWRFGRAPVVHALVVRAWRSSAARAQLVVGVSMVLLVGAWSLTEAGPLMPGVHGWLAGLVSVASGLSIRTLSGRRAREVPLLTSAGGYLLAATAANVLLCSPVVLAAAGFAAVDEGGAAPGLIALTLGAVGALLGPSLGSLLRLEADNPSGELAATCLAMVATGTAIRLSPATPSGAPQTLPLLALCTLVVSGAIASAYLTDTRSAPHHERTAP